MVRIIAALMIVMASAACSGTESESNQPLAGDASSDISGDANPSQDVGSSPKNTTSPENTTSPDDTTSPSDTTSPDTGPTPRLFGPHPVAPTPLEEGTIFTAPDGAGDACTVANPCDLWEAVDQAQAGDVVFMRGGVYSMVRRLSFRGRGTSPAPTIFESYPGEVAILDGTGQSIDDSSYIRVLGDPVVLRLFEVRNAARAGISVRTSNNVLEGLRVYDNKLSGIHIHESYSVPSSNYNLITDCEVFGNSGAGIGGAEHNYGGNSDGISISSGIGNRVENCLVYENSDDGIDTWRSQDGYVGYSISYGNGIDNGNGVGIKSGGASPSARTTVEHCLSYNNKATGFDHNSGVDVQFNNNTSWNNRRGYWAAEHTSMRNNIAYETDRPVNDSGTQSNNSWQRSGMPTPLSTDPNSPDFLVPAAGFEDIGAHAGR